MPIIGDVVPYTSTCDHFSTDLPILAMYGPIDPFTNMPILRGVAPFTSTCATCGIDLPIFPMYGPTDTLHKYAHY